MLSLSRHAAHLASSAAQATRSSSSSRVNSTQLLSEILSRHEPVKEATNSSTGPLNIARADTRPRRHDLGLEKRREARLAREAAAKKAKEAASRTNTPDRSRKHSQRDHRAQSSRPQSGTARSRREASRPGAAEAIMAISQQEAEMRAEAIKTAEENKSLEDMETDKELINESTSPFRSLHFTGPEPIPSNLDSMFNAIPNVTSSTPTIPASRKVSLDWVKRACGGDYSEYQSSTQDYVEGAQGPQSTYAKIVLEHNHSIPLSDQRRLLSVIQQMTRAGKPKPTAKV